MNLSAGFIRRPIATSLLMVAVVVLGAHRLLAAAGRGAAERELPDHPGLGAAAGRRRQDHGVLRRDAAGAAVRPDPGPDADDQQQRQRLHADHAAVRPQPHHRLRRGATCRRPSTRPPGQLPASLLTPPTYRKTNPADTPILLIALSSDTLPITTVSDYANSILAQKISQMPGVGLVGIGGLQSPSIHVQLNPAQLAAENLDLEDVRAALTNATVNQPKGQLYGDQQAFALQTNDQLMTAAGFEDVILAYRNGAPIRVRDVGRAVIAPEDPTQAGWLNTKRAVLLAVQRQPSANVVATVDAIKQALPQLQASLPPSIKVEVVSDRTQTIRASVVGRAVHPAADDRARGRRHRGVPAQALGDGDPGHVGADLADRHVRGDARRSATAWTTSR